MDEEPPRTKVRQKGFDNLDGLLDIKKAGGGETGAGSGSSPKVGEKVQLDGGATVQVFEKKSEGAGSKPGGRTKNRQERAKGPAKTARTKDSAVASGTKEAPSTVSVFDIKKEKEDIEVFTQRLGDGLDNFRTDEEVRGLEDTMRECIVHMRGMLDSYEQVPEGERQWYEDEYKRTEGELRQHLQVLEARLDVLDAGSPPETAPDTLNAPSRSDVPKENKTALADAVKAVEAERIARLKEKFESKKTRTTKETALQENWKTIQDEHLAKVKDFYKKRSALGQIGSQFVGDRTSKEVQQSKEKWEKARGEYLAQTIGTIDERRAAHKGYDLIQRDADTGVAKEEDRLQKHRGKSSLDTEKVRERYTRRYDFIKQAVIEPERLALEARMEGLGSRDKKALDHLFDKYKALPAPWRILGTSAVLLGAGAGVSAGLAAFAGIGAGASLVTLGMGGLSAVTRLGAFYQKNKTARGSLENVARATGIGGIVGLALEYSTRGIHGLFGTEKKAQATLAKQSGLGNLGNLNIFKNLLKQREKALTAKERIELQARWARSLGSLGAGAMIGEAEHLVHGALHPAAALPHAAGGNHLSEKQIQQGLDDVHSGKGHPAINLRPAPKPFPHTVPGQEAPAPGSAVPGAGVEAPPVEPAGVHESLAIGGKINDADKLLGHFGQRLAEQYGADGQPPESVKALFKLLNAHGGENHISALTEDNASIKLGFQDDGQLVHLGDKIYLNDHNEIVIERVEGGVPHVLIGADGKLNPIEHHAPVVQPHVVAEHEVETTVTTTPAEAAVVAKAGDVVTAHGPAEAPAPVPSAAAHVDHPGTGEALAAQAVQATETAPLAPPAPAPSASLEASPQEVAAILKGKAVATAPAVEAGTVTSTSTDGGLIADQRTVDSILAGGVPGHEHFTNTFGVDINPTVPARYEWHVPQSSHTYMVAHGGTTTEASAWAKDFVTKNPGSTVLFDNVVKDSLTGVVTHRMDSWESVAGGAVAHKEGFVNPETGAVLPPPDPKDFTKKLP